MAVPTPMPLAACVLALAWGMSRECPADDVIRVGIIGLDTSHAPAFAKRLNAAGDPQHGPGARGGAAYPKGSDDSAATDGS